MQIGIDASRANELEKTGTEWYAYHLIQKIKKIADPADQFILYSKDPLREGLEKLPANFHNRVLKWPPKFLWTQIRLSWEMLFKKPDLLFIPSHTIPLIHPQNTIITLHDIGFERFHELYSKEKIGYRKSFLKWLINLGVRLITLGKYGANEYDYHRFATRFALKHAKKIITPSEFTKKEILDLYPNIKPNKIVTIPISFSQTDFLSKPADQVINQTLNKYKINKPYLLFIGRLEEKKNTSGLVEAFRILKTKYNFTGQLVLLGKQGFRFKEVLIKIERYNMEKSVIIPGWVSEQERILLLYGATVFVFPSYYEGFGIPPLEAMACGVPVVASYAGSIPEVVGKAALLVNPHKPEDIARGINEVINNEQLRKKLIKDGYENIKCYSWKKTTEKTLHEF